MVNEQIVEKLSKVIQGEVRVSEPLSAHSTIKIGGCADVFAIPSNANELVDILKFARDEDVNTFVLGVGSNVLFRDGGIDGIVVSTAKLNTFSVRDSSEARLVIEAESGVMVSELVNFSVKEGVAGFEHLAGIPGTIGGAIFMNAGTHGGTISDTLVHVVAADKSGRMYKWPKEKLEFSYRHAKFPKACVVISAEFSLQRAPKEDICRKVNELRERRKERHPLNWPSLGSIFKNPGKGPSAGELIDEAGLKGVRIGGARIANEHGNWIINEGEATAKDIEVLVHLVREKVKENSGVSLEPEIVIVGRK